MFNIAREISDTLTMSPSSIELNAVLNILLTLLRIEASLAAIFLSTVILRDESLTISSTVLSAVNSPTPKLNALKIGSDTTTLCVISFFLLQYCIICLF